MNYRLLLGEMLIDYTERRAEENSLEKIQVYGEIIRDLKLALDIEVGEIALMNEVKNLIK